MSSALSVKLVGPKADAVRLLKVHLERGKTLRQEVPSNPEQVGGWRAKKDEWVGDTVALLKRIFDQPTVAEGFADTQGRFKEYPGEFPQAGDMMAEEMDLRVARLSVVLKRVDTSPESSAPAKREPAEIVTPPAPVAAAPAAVTPAPVPEPAKVLTKAVLVVSHGVDPKYTESAREVLTKLGLTPTVEMRIPGQPIELEAPIVAGFALMIMPHEDADCARPGSEKSLRSDIAFDLGFLCGRVGANKIAVLYPNGGDGFTCLRNIPHIPIDAPGGWILHLARQMKKAGVEIDLNRVL